MTMTGWKPWFGLFCAFVVICTTMAGSVTSSSKTIPMSSVNVNGYTDITVEEAWDLLTDTSNGVQIPIDVRRDNEWKVEHIDTPSPENPVHYPLSDLQEEEGLQEFLSHFAGEEVIIYCRTGGRSVSAATILVDAGFTGTIYNMLGGITAWTDSGYPTIPNRPPSLPEINGPTTGSPGQNYDFVITSTDPDNDEIFYCLNWSDETGEVCLGPYASGEEVTVSHTWAEQGTYVISVKARDSYNDESDWATLEVTMPKSRISFTINDVFKDHSWMISFLRYLLGL
jgi:rhodanese-related sulfurtransferase